MAKNLWNTQFPRDLNVLRDKADQMAEKGLDVHTVTVIVDDSSWRAVIEYTDEDLTDMSEEFWLDRYGGSLTPVRR